MEAPTSKEAFDRAGQEFIKIGVPMEYFTENMQ